MVIEAKNSVRRMNSSAKNSVKRLSLSAKGSVRTGLSANRKLNSNAKSLGYEVLNCRNTVTEMQLIEVAMTETVW